MIAQRTISRDLSRDILTQSSIGQFRTGDFQQFVQNPSGVRSFMIGV